MSRLNNLSLSVKLNLLLLLVLGVLLLATVLLLFFNTGNLTREIASERIAEEVNILKNRLAEVERELAVDVNFTASSIPFIQAVGRRNGETVTELITLANSSLEMDAIDVVDGDGNPLAALGSGETAADDALLRTALEGTAATDVLVEASIVEAQRGQVELSISAAAPVMALRQGTVLGAIQMRQQIDDDFLRELAFNPDGIYLGLIYDGQIRARTSTGSSASSLHRDIAFDPESVRAAASGQTTISDELITSGNVPYAVAYIPLSGSASPGALMILVELDEIFAFQNSTLLNTIIIFTLLAVIALSFIYLSLQRIAIRPLNALKTSAQKMTGGQYDQRIPARGQDEVGQLAETFNEMAEAIQQRETSLQAARAQAERADQVKSAFLASVSHELRTPLNSIINFTKFVIRGVMGPVNDEQKDTLNKVVGSGQHLLNLINDVLDISKIESGSLTLFVEADVDLDEVLQSAVSTGGSLLHDKPVTLNLDVDNDLPLIRADKQRLYQVMLNIISNACKFTEDGSITVSAHLHREDGEIYVTVKDTGPGIPAEDHQAVFEAFKQTQTGLRQGSGTGLGMPISRSLVQAHGGKMWLESAPGEGATFVVVLPVAAEHLLELVNV